MDTKLAHILQQTVETYKNVNPGLEGRAEGWEKWYSYWLLSISDIREYLGVEPTANTLEKLLLKADALYSRVPTTKSWAQFSADEIFLIVERYNRKKNNS
jgi:hypothetical protein